jgi:hypothetical protein
VTVVLLDESNRKYSFHRLARSNTFHDFIRAETAVDDVCLVDDRGPIDLGGCVGDICSPVRAEQRHIRVEIEFPNSETRAFTVERTARMGELKEIVAREFSEHFSFRDGDSEIEADIPVANFRGRIMCVPIAPEPVDVPIDLSCDDAPSSVGSVSPFAARGTPTRRYRFKWGEEIADLEVANGQRVSDTKTIVADHWNSMVELITLLYLGKQLKDRMILSSLCIPDEGHINVYIREMRSIYLRSCQDVSRVGHAKEVEPPADFETRVHQLVAETGQDEIVCMRCFRFYGYDFGKARAELQEA